MDEKTYEALKTIIKKTRSLLNEKYGNRKRLNKDEVWRKAVLLRDIVSVERWIDEVAKEYD